VRGKVNNNIVQTPLSTTPVKVNGWTLVTATFSITGVSQTIINIYFEKTLVAQYAAALNYVPNNERIHFGGPLGFIGRISKITIYSPGTTRVGGI